MNKRPPSFITIQVDRHSGEVSCRSQVKSQTFQDVELFQIGTFYNETGHVSSLEDLHRAYSVHGQKLYDVLDGAGTVIVIDQKKKKLLAFTDYFNSIMPLFYRETADSIVIGTDLLSLTAGMGDLTISSRAAHQFMLHGMVYGKRTLIQQVDKLPPKHFLVVDLETCRLRCVGCRYSIPATKVDDKAYDAALGKCVRECCREGAAITLSGGFDTNYILHHLQKIKRENGDGSLIQAYCGGGETGKDETSLAQEIADCYGNVDLHVFHVDRQSIQHFPEIVLALQGVCFEDGVFMHYHMAQRFHQDHVKFVYTGDLADQVLNLETFQYTRSTWKRMLLMRLRGLKHALLHHRYDFYQWMFRGRYETAALKLLKKGGLLWDYFGTEGIFPYIRRPFLSVAKGCDIPGDYCKQHHRRVVLNSVAPKIAEKIQRNGGNTDPVALFDEHTRNVLHDETSKMSWNKPRRFVNQNQQLGYELRVLYVDLVRRIFVDHEFKRADVGNFPMLVDLYPGFETRN